MVVASAAVNEASSLRIDRVSKTFGGAEGRGTPALERLSLSVAAGEMVSLIGPSGCGKSTLLRLLLGLIRLDAGRIEFDGSSVTAETARRVRLRVGF